MPIQTVLVVDPDSTDREATIDALSPTVPDANLLTADSLTAAIEVIGQHPVDTVVVSRYNLGDGTGLELADRIRDTAPDTGIILYAETDSIDTGNFEETVVEFVPKDTPEAADLLAKLVDQTGTEQTQTAYPVPDDEDERSEAVAAYTVDIEAVVPTLERITDLAVDRLGVEGATVNAISEHTQISLASSGQRWPPVDRGESICTHTIVHDGDVMAVEDVRDDPRFRDDEQLASSGIVAYLGAKIVVEGHPIGTLCVHDGKPRSFSAAERNSLATLAALVADVLVLNQGGNPA